MKILHTGDWHLGKRLDHYSRLQEQREVLDEICAIADREGVDAVLVAGDLFDHINPSTEAIELFYQTLKRLAKDGQRAVIGIAGNHDSPDRIEAPDPLARACGIILAGYPQSRIPPFRLDSGLEVTRSEPGILELKLPSISYPVRVLLTPYANGFRLKKFLGNEDPETELRTLLAAHWAEIAGKYCDTNGVNLLMAHLFFMKKGTIQGEEPEDEKPILTVGGAQAIFTENLPKEIQYAALGHLHRPHQVSESPCPAVYSGSPLAYSMSEAGQTKSVVILSVEPGSPAEYRTVTLESGRQLTRQTFEQVSEAVTWLTANPNTLVELTLATETYLTAADRKSLYDVHDGIISLIPRLTGELDSSQQAVQVDLSQDIESLFIDYFEYKHNQKPNAHLMELFREILAEDSDRE